MKITNKLLAFILTVSFLGGQLRAKIMDKTIATVNGQPIKFSEYSKNKAAVLEQYRKIMPDFFAKEGAEKELNKKVLDQMIDDELLKQKAKSLKIKVYDRELDNGIEAIRKRFAKDENGIPLKKEVSDRAFLDELNTQGLSFSEFREKIRGQLMTRKLIEQIIQPKIKNPTETEIKKYFSKIKLLVENDTSTLKGLSDDEKQGLTAVASKFKELSAERVRLKHIFIKLAEDDSFIKRNKVFKLAKSVKAKLDKGADFEDMAAQYSEDAQSAEKGGDLGYLFRGLLPKELEKKAFSMRVGEIAGPIKTKFGYHIIKLAEKRAKQKIRYELVKSDIAQIISSDKFTKALVAYVKELRKKADIKIFQKND